MRIPLKYREFKFLFKGLALLILLATVPVFNAQEKLGINNSNYYMSSSIFLNPSSSVDNWSFMQMHMVGANAYAKTNLGYLPKFSVWQMRRSGLSNPEISDSKTNKFLYACASGDGPALLISKRRFGGGFFVRARTVVNMHKMPHELTTLFLKGQDLPSASQFNIRNAGVSNMSWLEYGVNFGMMVKRERRELITVGGNARYLNGINIFYANMLEMRGFYNDTMLKLDTLRGKIRYNQAALGSGKGYGLDLGITYKKMLGTVDSYYSHSTRSGCKVVDYKYKIGLSLRDLGYIRFNGNTSVADVNGSSNFYNDVRFDNYQSVLNSIVNVTFTPKPITAFLPASISGQFDYNFENYLFVNATFVKNLIPHRLTGVQSADLLSICPRYEFRYFEFAMPLTFHRFIYPQVGFGLRLRSLVIGMDNLVPLIIRSNTYGLNVYFNLAVTLFKNPSCDATAPRVSDCSFFGSGHMFNKKKHYMKRIFRRRKTYSR